MLPLAPLTAPHTHVCICMLPFAPLSAPHSQVCIHMLPLAPLSAPHSQVCIHMLPLAPLPVSSAQPGMHMHAPSRTPTSSTQPDMHTHAPSHTPVSSAHAMCAPACFLSHPCLEPPITLRLSQDASSHTTGLGHRQPLLPEGGERAVRLGGEAPLHIKAVLPHSGTLPQERARIGRHHAVVGQREYLLTMRPDVAVLPPARLLPSEDRTTYRPPSLAPLVGGGRGPKGRHLTHPHSLPDSSQPTCTSAQSVLVSWLV